MKIKVKTQESTNITVKLTPGESAYCNPSVDGVHMFVNIKTDVFAEPVDIHNLGVVGTFSTTSKEADMVRIRVSITYPDGNSVDLIPQEVAIKTKKVVFKDTIQVNYHD